jgi:hypothetical protein
MILLDCMKALYIGAGLDAIPQNTFKHIREWICVDYEPCQCYATTPNPAQNNLEINDRFISRLSSVYNAIGFSCVFHDLEENKCIFTNSTTGQTIHYFYNYPFSGKYITPEMSFHINTTDTIVAKGYAPPADLLDMLPQNKQFPLICATNTVYDSEIDEEEDNMFARRYRKQLTSIISEYVLMNMKPFDAILYEQQRHVRSHEVAPYITLHSFEDLHLDKIKTHLFHS